MGYTLLHPFSLVPNFLRPSKIGPKRSLVLGLICGFSLSLSLTSLAIWARERWKLRWSQRPPTSQRPPRRHNTLLERQRDDIEIHGDSTIEGVEGLIGNTPLVRINSLSDLLGVEILGKCEYLNPFGSVKDRVSLRIIQQAEEAGLIAPHTNSTIFEGTSGSTGISIAGIARSRGYNAHIVLPDDVAEEKVQMLKVLGATVEKVRPVSIVDKKHYVNLARLRALEFGQTQTRSSSSSSPATSHTIVSTTSCSTPSRTPIATTPTASLSRHSSRSNLPDLVITESREPRRRKQDHNDDDEETDREEVGGITRDDDAEHGAARGLFADQFENLSNYSAHATSTAPEIFSQTSGLVDAFVSGAGTGGTIAGVGRTLKRLTNGRCEVVLSDPEGSGLYYWVREGVMWNEREEEGKRRRFQVDTIVEGIGLNRITKNLKLALPIIDDAYRVTDREALSMSRHLASQDGLFLGSSSAVNLVTCVRLAQRWLRDNHADEVLGLHGTRKLRIVTILCDSGTRHTSKFWNEEYLARNGIDYPSNLDWLFSNASSASSSSSSSPGISTESQTSASSHRPIARPPSLPTPPSNAVDHGEINLSLQDDDFASSAPKDLPPLSTL